LRPRDNDLFESFKSKPYHDVDNNVVPPKMNINFTATFPSDE